MPNKKHIHKAKFSAAKIVPSTATKPVLGALDQIYTEYETPAIHRTNSGPPFNSTAFSDYCKSKAIIHHKIYPYISQANPVETFIKSLGKAIKIANHKKQDTETALNNLLSYYCTTPHPATGAKPAVLLFRIPYHQDFPIINEHTAIPSQNAAEKDSLTLPQTKNICSPSGGNCNSQKSS